MSFDLLQDRELWKGPRMMLLHFLFGLLPQRRSKGALLETIAEQFRLRLKLNERRYCQSSLFVLLHSVG